MSEDNDKKRKNIVDFVTFAFPPYQGVTVIEKSIIDLWLSQKHF